GRHLNGTAFGVLVLALLYFELAAAGAYTDISPADPTRGFQQQAIVEFLRNDPTLFRIDTRTDIDELWQPDTAALAGLQDVGGVANPLLLRSFHHYWEATGGRASRAYDLLNVKYVLVREGTELPGDKFARVFGPVDGLEVYENRAFVPRAWVAPAGADLAALAPPAAPGDATVTTYSSGAMSVQAVAPEGGYLILSELWYPGWRATVNGAAAAIEQANGALRAVALPPGTSTVELRFWPASFTWGLIAAAAGLVLAAFAAFGPRRELF
ncbi:MAG: YfhO family protein, partial [Caldilineaceae bacterium]|nr:YfhO family protein [Caldilineaceae bacterium]